MRKNPQRATEKLNILDIFLLSTVLTILSIRGFLELTGYPQLGNADLHIAHMLWGGLGMLLMLLVLLLADKPNKYIVSFLSGVSFGFFIDEIGKFVTSDNDYFFEPTAMLIYLILLSIWAGARLAVVRLYKGDFISEAQWPKRKNHQKAILVYAIISGLLALAYVGNQFLDRQDSIELASPIKLMLLVASAGIVILCYLGVRYFRLGAMQRSASAIRTSAILTIVLVYPVTFYRKEFGAAFGCLLALIVVIGLSETSLKSIIKPLFAKDMQK